MDYLAGNVQLVIAIFEEKKDLIKTFILANLPILIFGFLYFLIF